MDAFEEPREAERWRAIKMFRAAEMSWAEITNTLIADELLDCRNHTEKRVAVKSGGIEICTTCEDTLTAFWRRNLWRLKSEDVPIVEATWKYRNALERVSEICLRNAERDEEVVSYQQALDADGNRIVDASGEAVVIRTVRVVRRVNTRVLQLYIAVHERLARMSGYNVKNPDPFKETQRKLLKAYEQLDGDTGPRPN